MAWQHRLLNLFRSRSIDAEIREEMEFHLEMRARALQQRGIAADEAEYQARRRFGSLSQWQEQTRGMDMMSWLDSVVQDLRYAWRVLLKSPGFAVSTVLILALGIGANTALFSVVDAVLLRPFPLPKPEQLVLLFDRTSKEARGMISLADLEDWRSQSKTLSQISAYAGQSVSLSGVEEPSRIVGAFVSANYLSMMGAKPMLGRDFAAGDDAPGAERQVILSHSMWQSRCGADRSILGRRLLLNGEAYTVIGVMPPDFHEMAFEADIWMPIFAYPNYQRDRGIRTMVAIGRLRDGVTMQQSQSEFNTLSGRLASQYPETNRDHSVQMTSMQELRVQSIRTSLLVLLGVAGFVLLIACANVANLLLAKALGRAKEVALHAALGAGRARIIRQLLTESLLLSGFGCLAGIALAWAGVRAIATWQSDDVPSGIEIALNPTALVFAAAVAVVCAMLFGLMPALQICRGWWNEALRQRQNSGGAPLRTNARAVLVVAQVALALVLLVGAGLLTQSFLKLQSVDPGFAANGLLTMEYRLPKTKYREGTQQTRFHEEVVARVRQLPGVRSAGVIRGLPFSGNGMVVPFVAADRPEPPLPDRPRTRYNATDVHLFEAMGIPLLRGRTFDATDRADGPKVVVINEALARRFWPGQDPIGRSVKIPARDFASNQSLLEPARIIGVVGNIKHDGLSEAEMPQVYVPYAQDPFIFATLVVRTDGDPMQLSRAVQKAVWSIDRDQPVWKIRTLQSMISGSVSGKKALTTLLGGFSLLAVLLSAIGLYGVISYSVAQRTSELGIRAALGALPRDLMTLVLGEGVRLTLAGIVVGLGGAWWLTRFLQTELFGVTATDPTTYVAMGALLLLIALLACVLPVRRATRIDPVIALRCE